MGLPADDGWVGLKGMPADEAKALSHNPGASQEEEKAIAKNMQTRDAKENNAKRDSSAASGGRWKRVMCRVRCWRARKDQRISKRQTADGTE